MAAPLSAFQGIEANTTAQKAALANLVAQQGTRGAEVYKQMAAGAQAQGAQSAALAHDVGASHTGATVGASPQLAAQLKATATAPSATYAQDAAAGATAYQQDMGRLSAANSNYMGAAAAAAPIVASTTNRQVQQIMADLQARREEMAYQAQSRKQDQADRNLQRQRDNEDYVRHVDDWNKEHDPNAPMSLHDQAAAARDQATIDKYSQGPPAQRRDPIAVAKSLGMSPEVAAKLMGTKAYAAMNKNLVGYGKANKDANYNGYVNQARGYAKQYTHDQAMQGNKVTVDPALIGLLANQWADYGHAKHPHHLKMFYNMDNKKLWGKTTASKRIAKAEADKLVKKQAAADRKRRQKQAEDDRATQALMDQAHMPTTDFTP